MLTQLQMGQASSHWNMLEPGEMRWQEGIPLGITRALKRRFYLVEKARNACIVGVDPTLYTLNTLTYRKIRHSSKLCALLQYRNMDLACFLERNAGLLWRKGPLLPR